MTGVTRHQTWREFAAEERDRLRNGARLWNADMVMSYLGVQGPDGVLAMSRSELRKLTNGTHTSGLLLPCHRRTPRGEPLFREADVLWLLYQMRTPDARDGPVIVPD